MHADGRAEHADDSGSYIILEVAPKPWIVEDANRIAAELSVGKRPRVLIENECALVISRNILSTVSK